jgi:hypothetical protein
MYVCHYPITHDNSGSRRPSCGSDSFTPAQRTIIERMVARAVTSELKSVTRQRDLAYLVIARLESEIALAQSKQKTRKCASDKRSKEK